MIDLDEYNLDLFQLFTNYYNLYDIHASIQSPSYQNFVQKNFCPQFFHPIPFNWQWVNLKYD